MDSVDPVVLALMLGIGAAMGMEHRWPRRPLPPSEMGRFVANGGLGVIYVVGLGAVMPSPADVAAWLPFTPPLAAFVASPSGATAMAIMGVLVLDLAHYVLHRLNHGLGPLWRLHRVHHSDRELDITTTFRHHPLEHLANALPALAFVAGAGIPIYAVTLHAALGWLLACYQHSNAKLPEGLERMLGCVFVTAPIHAIHHSAAPAEGNANFGIVFSIWDRCAGTLVEPAAARLAALRYGVDGRSGPDSLLGLLSEPLRR